MAKILFFNPPSRENVYLNTNVSVGAPSYPNLTLATLAANLVGKHEVKIVDLDIEGATVGHLSRAVMDFSPDVVAASAKTPDYPAVCELMRLVKKLKAGVRTIVGGVHVTACPQDAAAEPSFDIVVLGEADMAISEILAASDPGEVAGIIYHRASSGEPVVTPPRKLIDDINSLSYPAWDLFNLNLYKNSRLSSRKNPVGHIETSRGCAYQCNFCSKLIFGSRQRSKNPSRVVDEMEYMLRCGFKEIHIADDSFTQDIARAKEVCSEILRRGLKFPWALINGVRVNMVDYEFLSLAKRSGCWQVGFGIETGDQGVLNRIGKKITLQETERAIHLAKKAGLDTFGFFIFALAKISFETRSADA